MDHTTQPAKVGELLRIPHNTARGGQRGEGTDEGVGLGEVGGEVEAGAVGGLDLEVLDALPLVAGALGHVEHVGDVVGLQHRAVPGRQPAAQVQVRRHDEVGGRRIVLHVFLLSFCLFSLYLSNSFI
jgi:hypothetical protein